MNTTAYRSRPKQYSRVPHDFYPTPPEAVKALLSVESFEGSIWEPACGNGAISKVLTDTGHEVISTDLIDRGYGKAGIDFLLETQPRAKHIITNPPYGKGLADGFIRKALQLTQKTGGNVAMLCDLRCLCHPSRHEKFIKTPPAVIYGLDHLICWPEGKVIDHAGYGSMRYCWIIWKANHQGATEFRWLSATQFKA